MTLAAPASAVRLLSAIRPSGVLPLSCRHGASVLDAAGVVLGTVVEISRGEWATVRWADGLVSDVHGSTLGEVPAEPTATEALLAAGYTHRRSTERGAALGEHDVIRISDGAVVARMKAHEVWGWLANRGGAR